MGADAKGGKIATQGWAEVSELTPVELGRRFEDAGVAAILFTDIDGDGLLKGVNVAATAALARALSIPVIASGGVGSIADIDALIAAREPGIEGVVVGRALYDGRIDAAEALGREQLSSRGSGGGRSRPAAPGWNRPPSPRPYPHFYPLCG